MLNETLFPTIGKPVDKLPDCDIHDKHHIGHKPPHAFTLQEQFMETVNRVNDTLCRINRQSEFIKRSVEEFTSKISADNATFKDLVVSTYNQFSSTVTAEVNAFETEIKLAYKAFADDIKLNWNNFQLKYDEFETHIDERIDNFRAEIDASFEEYKSLCSEGFEAFKVELEGMHTAHKAEINEMYNTFRDTIENRLSQYNANYVKSFTDYCTAMDGNFTKMENDFSELYDDFTNSITADITAFKLEWTAQIGERLDGQDAKIADAELYMKTNLIASINQIVDELIVAGQIDTIATQTYARIKSRIPEIVNVAEYFGADVVKSSNLATLLNNAITANPENFHGKTIYIPNGEYDFGEIQLRIYSKMSIVGESKTGVKIKGYFNSKNTKYYAFISVKPLEGENNIEYVTIKNLSFESMSEEERPANTTIHRQGIHFTAPSSHVIVDNVSIANVRRGIEFTNGSWVSELSNIDIGNVENGILYAGPGTSTHLKNVYVMSASQTAYDFTGLGYSAWENVCCDWCDNLIYKFNSCSISIDGSGIEGLTNTGAVSANNSNIFIKNATWFSGMGLENYVLAQLNGSNVHIKGLKLDTYDGEIKENAGKFYNLSTNSKLIIEDMKCSTKFLQPSTSSDPDNVITFRDRNNDFTINNHKTVIGQPIASGDGNNELKHTDRDYLTGSIWFNNVGSPRNGLGHDDRYAVARKCGDLFVNNQPFFSGVAMWQQVTAGEDINVTGQMTMTKVSDTKARIVIKNYQASARGQAYYKSLSRYIWYKSSLGESVYCAFTSHPDKIFKIAMCASLGSQEDTDLTIEVVAKTGDATVTDTTITIDGANIVFSPMHPNLIILGASDIANTEFRAIQHILTLNENMDLLDYGLRFKDYLPNGTMVFEEVTHKPMWHYNGVFYYADGSVAYDANI